MKRSIIEIDEEKCDGCGLCIPSCKEGALKIVNGKAKLISDSYCDGLGACTNHCPKGALKVIEREADEFRHNCVKSFSKTLQSQNSLKVQSNQIIYECVNDNNKYETENNNFNNQISELSHWPIQLRLVPSNAEFLKNADILLCADCVPFAFPNLHKKYIRGRVVLVGCPKLDDSEYYVSKLAEILKNSNIRSIKVLIMEVPCCRGLVTIIKKAIHKAEITIQISVDIISIGGALLESFKS